MTPKKMKIYTKPALSVLGSVSDLTAGGSFGGQENAQMQGPEFMT